MTDSTFDPNLWLEQQKNHNASTSTVTQAKNINETVFHQINKSNVDKFIIQSKNSGTIDLSELKDFDCAGLQALLALSDAGATFTNINNDLKLKLSIAGALHLG